MHLWNAFSSQKWFNAIINFNYLSVQGLYFVFDSLTKLYFKSFLCGMAAAETRCFHRIRESWAGRDLEDGLIPTPLAVGRDASHWIRPHPPIPLWLSSFSLDMNDFISNWNISPQEKNHRKCLEYIGWYRFLHYPHKLNMKLENALDILGM